MYKTHPLDESAAPSAVNSIEISYLLIPGFVSVFGEIASSGVGIAASATFLKAAAIECFVLSISYCFDGYFNGIGKTTLVMVRGVAAALLVRIPYASTRPDSSLFQIGLATAYAAIFMLVFCCVEYLVRKRKTAESANTAA